MLRVLSWTPPLSLDSMQTQPPQLSITPNANTPNKRKRSFDASIVDSMAQGAVKGPPQVESKKWLPLAPATNIYVAPQAEEVHESAPSVLLPRDDGVSESAMDVDFVSMSGEKLKSKEAARLATMRQAISSQLSLEILMKHRELRLIDQELAKCQVALEQLRRCAEIPFPALRLPSEQVSLGKGPAIKKQNERFPPRSPAPWGVADGPYSRHYARWLLPDSQFDGGDPELAAAVIGTTSVSGRSTRGHFTDFASLAGKASRSQRALSHAALPAGYTEPKQKPTGPMVLKRKSDGKMVKLVCPDCRRSDFGSAQGFINHCRIGHQRNYASHDAAAEGCGEPLNETEANAVAAPQPQTSGVIIPVAISPASPLSISATSNMHPLVKSAHEDSKNTPGIPLVKGGYVLKSERKASKQKKALSQSSQKSQTSYLAALVEDRGLSLNLRDIVADAKTKVDLGDHEEEDEMELDSPVPQNPGHRRHPAVGNKHPGKSSAKAAKFSSTHLRDDGHGASSDVQTPNEDPHLRSYIGLLPSPTNESTQAPSLIDDDEELDPQSPPSSDELDEADVHFHIRDDEHPEDSHDLRSSEIQTPTATCTPTTAATPGHLPSPAPFTRPLSSKDDRHVNFIAEQPVRVDSYDKKRRKIAK